MKIKEPGECKQDEVEPDFETFKSMNGAMKEAATRINNAFKPAKVSDRAIEAKGDYLDQLPGELYRLMKEDIAAVWGILESPIEQVAIFQLASENYSNREGFPIFARVARARGQFSHKHYPVQLIPQVTFGPYRVDFLFDLGSRGLVAMDAERDKARDRHLSEHFGVGVLRATGREIWRDNHTLAFYASDHQGKATMSKNRWFKFYPSDFLAGIHNLEQIEVTAYIVVLCELYDNEGSCRRDDAVMARRCRMRRAVFTKALDGLISKGKVDVCAGLLTNRRVSKEIENRLLNASERTARRDTAATQPRHSHDMTATQPRHERAEKHNEINKNCENVRPYIESRNKNKETSQVLRDLRLKMLAEPLPQLSDKASAIASRRH